jgi:hypothetical protein
MSTQIQIFNMAVFNINIRKYIQNFLKFHYGNLHASIEFWWVEYKIEELEYNKSK